MQNFTLWCFVLVEVPLLCFFVQDNLPLVKNKQDKSRVDTVEFRNYESLCRGEDALVSFVSYPTPAVSDCDVCQYLVLRLQSTRLKKFVGLILSMTSVTDFPKLRFSFM